MNANQSYRVCVKCNVSHSHKFSMPCHKQSKTVKLVIELLTKFEIE